MESSLRPVGFGYSYCKGVECMYVIRVKCRVNTLGDISGAPVIIGAGNTPVVCLFGCDNPRIM